MQKHDRLKRTQNIIKKRRIMIVGRAYLGPVSAGKSSRRNNGERIEMSRKNENYETHTGYGLQAIFAHVLVIRCILATAQYCVGFWWTELLSFDRPDSELFDAFVILKCPKMIFLFLRDKLWRPHFPLRRTRGLAGRLPSSRQDSRKQSSQILPKYNLNYYNIVSLQINQLLKPH